MLQLRSLRSVTIYLMLFLAIDLSEKEIHITFQIPRVDKVGKGSFLFN